MAAEIGTALGHFLPTALLSHARREKGTERSILALCLRAWYKLNHPAELHPLQKGLCSGGGGGGGLKCECVNVSRVC
ncbi:hypothetical protein E2C01_066515 [Portunus trituberculatus]|uniref:Uncharacterized protein n=1 Tax=Portunus trituberculatus TaxID=210409 RepID=A0A5B7HSI6_PORTR|nr:hypothetical protein [Portunus trituberculatus]